VVAVRALLESGNVDVNGGDNWVRLLSALRQTAAWLLCGNESALWMWHVIMDSRLVLSCMDYQYGRTALHWASLFGRVPVVELLLEGGANLNAATEVCWNFQSCRAFLSVDVAWV
jgi:hypothetical protein